MMIGGYDDKTILIKSCLFQVVKIISNLPVCVMTSTQITRKLIVQMVTCLREEWGNLRGIRLMHGHRQNHREEGLLCILVFFHSHFKNLLII